MRKTLIERGLAAIAALSIIVGGIFTGAGTAQAALPDEHAEPPPASVAITFDLAANWDVTAPAQSPPGAALLAYFVVNANDVEHGTAGFTDFTVVLEGVNAGLATFARGSITNAGRTLTVPFRDFQLATSERFGFSLIGDQQGDMGAIVRVLDSEGGEVARAELDLRPVLPGTQAWDAILSQAPHTTGGLQDQVVVLPINLTLDRTSPIPEGDLVFYVGFDDVNAASATNPAASRFTFTGPIDTLTNLPTGAGDPTVIGGGPPLRGIVSRHDAGWQVRLPANSFNPFQDIPITGNHGNLIGPDLRVFGTINLRFATGQIAQAFPGEVLFAGNLRQATWGQVPETDLGIETTVAGQLTVNNRVALSFAGGRGFDSGWHPGDNSQRWMWGDAGVPWAPASTGSLQIHSAQYAGRLTASTYLPYGSEVLSTTATYGPGYVANCIAIDPAVTPFQGRVAIFQGGGAVNPDQARLWYTTAPVGDLVGIDCHTLTGWREVSRFGLSGTTAAFELPNPDQVTALRAIGRTQMTLTAINFTRMPAPQYGGWLTARGWWPTDGDINDVSSATANSEHMFAGAPNQIFASTNYTRDVLFGNYGFPRIVKAVSNTAPAYGETVTFTIRAANVSNLGTMAMVIHDQMDARLQFVPGTVRVDGTVFADPQIGPAGPGRFVPSAEVYELVFDLGQRPVNRIVYLTFDAVARWDVGTVINSAWMEPTEQARHRGFSGITTRNGTLSQVSLHRQLTGTVELTKNVARSYMASSSGDLAGSVSAANEWVLEVANGTSGPVSSTIVDIFPFDGDGRGTTENAQHYVTSFETNHAVTVFYTLAPSSSLNPDPHYLGNQNPGQSGSIWRRWYQLEAGEAAIWNDSGYGSSITAPPTGFLIVTANPIHSGYRAIYRIGFTAHTPLGDSGSFVNYAWQRDGANVLRLVRAAVTIAEFPEITVTKTIAGQNAITVPANTPQTVDFVLTNTGTEPLRYLTFVDVTLLGPPVEDIVFADMALNDAGYLAASATGELITLEPGESITAIGMLPGLDFDEVHENVVSVSGIGLRSGQLVHDDDVLVVDVEPEPEVVEPEPEVVEPEPEEPTPLPPLPQPLPPLPPLVPAPAVMPAARLEHPATGVSTALLLTGVIAAIGGVSLTARRKFTN